MSKETLIKKLDTLVHYIELEDKKEEKEVRLLALCLGKQDGWVNRNGKIEWDTLEAVILEKAQSSKLGLIFIKWLLKRVLKVCKKTVKNTGEAVAFKMLNCLGGNVPQISKILVFYEAAESVYTEY